MARKDTQSGRHPDLSRVEMSVMGIVWELGDCTSAAVIAEFAKIRPLAPTTIRTVLTKLREKGYVELVPTVERGYKFHACVSRETVARRSFRELLPSLFQGSPRQAIAHLLADTDISDSDLDEIRRMIDSRKQSTRKQDKGTEQ